MVLPMLSVQEMMQSANYRPLLELLKTFRNGVVYGVKIRAPHTLVMSLIWSRGTPLQILEKIVKNSKQHGLNLGFTAVAFKLICMIGARLLTLIGSAKAVEGGAAAIADTSITAAVPVWLTFVAGSIAGSIFWGESNPINTQVTMYLISRVLSGLLFSAVEKYGVKVPGNGFRALSGAMWGLVLVLFLHRPATLQTSLQQSMAYIYKESAVFTNLWDLLIMNNATTV
jgi:peroxisomal membrane protein 4